ncbi:hypothetical protein NEOLEDRAFT_1137512 [Neolentinus lepideus HHB14362 ss-1]|uniref:Uncharacterized protein n=1 Tax=Neolentinus lepideus HHB14362 ss-1 TaxID=1314782 RepID=A0A165QQC1_9AGAM|nr:hypothetical protein NEOLEDRAFT_1137512 [Neolentinus lepideus HHB14362 ss-1]
MGYLTRLRHQKSSNLSDLPLSHSSLNPLQILTVGCHRCVLKIYASSLVTGVVYVKI